MLATLAPSIRRGSSDQATVGRRCASRYELRFRELFKPGRSLVFPCDADGNVDIDSLPARARVNYFYARTSIGREFCTPVTCRIGESGGERIARDL